MLESKLHESSSFVTLTYDDEHLPPGGSLNPRDTTLWLKRHRIEMGSFRYYLVGEYGDRWSRPHYHAILYGVPPCPFSEQFKNSRISCTCPICRTLEKTWKAGKIHSGTLTAESAQYVAGYVTKKMTKADDPRLLGRHPEFARMSLRPGIGARAASGIADALNSPWGAASIALHGDVPTTLRSEGKQLPLGRYIRRKIREEMGFDEIGGQAQPMAEQQAEMQALLDSENLTPHQFKRQKPFIEHQKILQIEGKQRIFSKKGSI